MNNTADTGPGAPAPGCESQPESHRLNPLRLEDWKLCFDIGDRSRLYRYSWPLVLGGGSRRRGGVCGGHDEALSVR